jgi:TolB-like protein
VPRLVRFDRYDVDLSAGQIRTRGIRIRLRDQSFQVLAALLERPGELVSREQLRRRLWPEEVFVDVDNVLNAAVARLREALGDSAVHPRFIETLPRRGYRFLVPVSEGGTRPEHSRQPLARLVVLPFLNLSGEADQDIFSDVMTEAVITELASISPDHLGVIARTTAMHYKGTRKDVAHIARELNVDYIVEGSARRDRRRVTISVQLVRAGDQTHQFVRRYDAHDRDVVSLGRAIAEAIAAQIEAPGVAADIRRHAGPRVGRRGSTANLAAYNEYVQGRYLQERVTPEALAGAMRHYERAIALDREFALAHDAVADLYTVLGYFGYMRPRDAYSKGIWYARRAVEIDDTLAEAHAVLAEYHKQLDYDWPAAEREMTRALELNPTSPFVRVRHAVATLMPKNRIAEAINEIERALESDPLSVFTRAWLAVMLLLAEDYDGAIEEAERLIELEPASCWPPWIVGVAYRQKHFLASTCVAPSAPHGSPAPNFATAAIEAHLKAIECLPGSTFFLGWLGMAYGMCGRESDARAVLEQLRRSERYVLPSAFAHTHLGLGELDAAFEWFDRAVDDRDQMMMPILSFNLPFRDDPRFVALVQKMNLA